MDAFKNTAEAVFQFQDEYNIQKGRVLQPEIIFQTKTAI
jgi:hypothetical protein